MTEAAMADDTPRTPDFTPRTPDPVTPFSVTSFPVSSFSVMSFPVTPFPVTSLLVTLFPVTPFPLPLRDVIFRGLRAKWRQLPVRVSLILRTGHLYLLNIYAIQYIIHTFIKNENAFKKFYDGSCKIK